MPGRQEKPPVGPPDCRWRPGPACIRFAGSGLHNGASLHAGRGELPSVSGSGSLTRDGSPLQVPGRIPHSCRIQTPCRTGKSVIPPETCREVRYRRPLPSREFSAPRRSPVHPPRPHPVYPARLMYSMPQTTALDFSAGFGSAVRFPVGVSHRKTLFRVYCLSGGWTGSSVQHSASSLPARIRETSGIPSRTDGH